MERKIGEIFNIDNEWYQAVKSNGEYCKGCAFYEKGCKAKYADVGSCGASRKDWTEVIFKKLEKVGEPYPLYGHIVQRYVGVIFPVALTEKRFINCNEINNTIDIEVKQDKENTEDMEVNEKTMPVPDGWEFDRIDESGNIVLKEKKKELPKTWLGCLKCVNDLELIEDGCCIEKWNFARQDDNGYIYNEQDHNLLPLSLAGPMLALCQLLICRNAWWKQLGWKPDWTDRTEYYYCITNYSGVIDTPTYSLQNTILAFPSEDIANQFLDTFRDLIEEAKELL